MLPDGQKGELRFGRPKQLALMETDPLVVNTRYIMSAHLAYVNNTGLSPHRNADAQVRPSMATFGWPKENAIQLRGYK
ncbi:hypothetical protein ANO14919_046250 [Xylariales sp. No.14919]|nr:hypothetical protein ANO14919_046250 [Xylariales sp. No.14919]